MPRRPAHPPPSDGLDPEGHFIARVRGEEAARLAPHPMTETDDTALAAPAASAEAEDDEGLGELPWGYGDDALVALPRDPRTLFLYWCHARETVARAFAGIDRARVQLRIFAGIAGDGWEQVRAVEFALESRGYYVHDLEPGRLYRAEIHVVGRGTERPLGAPSNEVRLPPSGPSPLLDDRFVRIPWEVPLDRWVREEEPGGTFPDDLREHLSHLSGGPGEPGGRAPGAAPGGGAASSPVGGWGGGSGPGREGH